MMLAQVGSIKLRRMGWSESMWGSVAGSRFAFDAFSAFSFYLETYPKPSGY